MRPITTSVSTFSDVIANGFVYVDKTAYLRELLRDGKNQYFLARPRRFGKSLTISTLQCIEMPKFVYVLEFKIRGTSAEAMAQIEEKGYAAKYASDPRKVFRIGCAFDWEKRNLGQWIIA